MVINFKELSWDKLNNISYLDFGYKLGISDITYVGTDMKCIYPHISKLYDCGIHVFVKIGQIMLQTLSYCTTVQKGSKAIAAYYRPVSLT